MRLAHECISRENLKIIAVEVLSCKTEEEEENKNLKFNQNLMKLTRV